MKLYLKVPILMFIALNVAMMITAGLPDKSEVGRRFLRLISPYQSFFALDQNWSMFAPNPSSTNSYVEAVIRFTDGSTERWTFPRASQISSVDRFTAGERFRKFSQEGLRPVEQKKDVWKNLGQFIERDVVKLESFGKKRTLEKLEFYRYSNRIKDPAKVFVNHGVLSKQFDSEMIYEYRPATQGAKNDNQRNG